MGLADLLCWPSPCFTRERNRASQIAWALAAILAFIAASGLAAAQSTDAPWTGQVSCNLNLQSQGYTRQETQTWTINGPMLRMNGAMQIFPVTWTVTGSGLVQRTQNGLTSSAQWNTTVPPANLTFSIYVRASDRRLMFTQWGSQASSENAIRGLRQAVWNGAQQQAVPLARPAWEWHFPPIEADPTDINPSGIFSIPAEALPAELAGPRDLPAIANCSYHFSRSATPSQPVVASNTVTTQKTATLSQTPAVNPLPGSAGAPKSISPIAVSNGPARQTSGLAAATPSSTAQTVSAPSVTSVSTAKVLSSSQSNNPLMPANTPTAPAQVAQTNPTDPSAGNAGNAGIAGTPGPPDTTSPANTDGTSNPNAPTTPSSASNTSTTGPDPSAGTNGTQTQNVKVFLNPGNAASFTYIWIPLAGVTQVTVQIWGGGGSGALGTGVVTASGGSGGGYSSTLLNVTPGVIYNIIVGGGGQGPNVFGNASGQDGFRSSFSSGGKILLFADGGYKGVLNLIEPVPGGSPDPSATVGQAGSVGTPDSGGHAFQSDSCPGFGIAGRGGDANQYGQPGCVVLTW